ncbi:MAG: tRNA uridine-5-carboxymethylaminomethyl(34) synthesis GTPase MnmE, partial [Spirochaetaceae bacterium]|nr:tRNA uridine-5-carboxymethylaminomethyl(34) synthesis GTPase MnmE [Spirochaetaceae bacterium]
VKRLCGVLSREIQQIQNLIIGIVSEVELLLDYSELDGVDGENSLNDKQKSGLELIIRRLSALSESYRVERILQQGALVVLAGKTNAGKSSLFNLLINEERSIVSDIPGTTRDWIESRITLDGIPLRLTDTAGLRDSCEAIEKLGIERSISLLQESDIILYLIDGAEGLTKEDSLFIDEYKTDHKIFLLWNKSDIAAPKDNENYICVSAKTGMGTTSLLDKIRDYISDVFLSDSIENNAASLGTERQKKLIETAHNEITNALNACNDGMPLDIVAPSLREALGALGEITGEVSTADILQEMFSRFCVGK